jgi:hypothetical protein
LDSVDNATPERPDKSFKVSRLAVFAQLQAKLRPVGLGGGSRGAGRACRHGVFPYSN